MQSIFRQQRGQISSNFRAKQILLKTPHIPKIFSRNIGYGQVPLQTLTHSAPCHTSCSRDINIANFFDQTPKTTLYPELKVQLFVHNFLTTHFGLKSGQLLTSLPTFYPSGKKMESAGIPMSSYTRPPVEHEFPIMFRIFFKKNLLANIIC